LRDAQNAFFSFAFHERVVDLHEIDLLALDHARNFAVAAGRVMRDADVACSFLRLPLAEGGEVRLHIDEVMHLHQVDALGFHHRQRTLH